MELTEYLKKNKGSEGYRIFLTGLNKQFKSAGVLYREFKILERMTTIALKIIHFVHSFTHKQHRAIYGKLQTEVASLADCINRGRVCFIKNEDLNQL